MAATLVLAQQQPATQQPAAPQGQQQQKPAQKPAESNPFPEDTNSVPVVPTNDEPAAAPAPAPSTSDNAGSTSLLKDDTDPVHSPDDPAPGAADSDGFSSSLSGSNDVNIPDETKPATGRRKLKEPSSVHQETAKEDEDVGDYELGQKHWKAALSRFQSALVTDPENPDVYWGMAEAQRNLGDFANAKANYLKVTEYDPDSKHGKEAKKLLKAPEIAKAVVANPTAAAPQPQQ